MYLAKCTECIGKTATELFFEVVMHARDQVSVIIGPDMRVRSLMLSTRSAIYHSVL